MSSHHWRVECAQQLQRAGILELTTGIEVKTITANHSVEVRPLSLHEESNTELQSLTELVFSSIWGAMSEPTAPRVTKPRGSMDMDASIWSQLPFEMVGHVLSFLLLPDVCRNRTECKKWNQLILSGKFAALHGQHARRRRGPSFIAMNVRRPDPAVHEEDREVWCCLDLSARRWYTFDEDEYNIGPFVSGVQSMDGGLVCRLRLAQLQPSSHSIIVHNVKGLTKVTLPEIERHLNSPDDPKLLMVTESTAFKIFLINHNFNTGIEILDDPLLTSEERLKIQYDPLIHVYDSATCEWKSIVNTSWIEHGGLGYIRSIVMYQGFLYVLFLGYEFEGDEAFWRLQRYNLTGESREYVDVCTYGFITSSLVVSNDCLFLVLWCKEECSDSDRSEEWFFEVREIRTRDMTQETVLKLSAADVKASFDIETASSFGINPLKAQFDLLSISVVGFESSLFFMSQASGQAKLFDLVTRSWDHGLPSNPLGSMHNEVGGPWIGKHMNLLLPWNTDW